MNIKIVDNKDIENKLNNGINEIVKAMKEFPDFTIKGLIVTNQYYEQLIKLCFEKGIIVIAEENNKIIGCIMSLINANIFTAMNELVTVVTWVNKDKRNSSAFYRMFKLYKNEFQKLKKEIDEKIMKIRNKVSVTTSKQFIALVIQMIVFVAIGIDLFHKKK